MSDKPNIVDHKLDQFQHHMLKTIEYCSQQQKATYLTDVAMREYGYPEGTNLQFDLAKVNEGIVTIRVVSEEPQVVAGTSEIKKE